MKVSPRIVIGIAGFVIACAMAVLASRWLSPREHGHAGAATRSDAASKTPSGPKPNIVLVTIDTLRGDRLGVAGRPGDITPTLDRLAQDGVYFKTAYSTSSWTAPATVSLLSGLYPARHGVEHGAVSGGAIEGQEMIPDDVVLLTEVLKRGGYRTYGITANGHLDPHFGFARGFDQYECLGFVDAGDVVARLDAWKTQIASGGRPYFMWLHLLDPHSPYVPYEPWLTSRLGNAPRFPELDRITPAKEYETMNVSGDRLQYVQALYDGEVRRSDDVTAQMLQALDAERDAIIVVLSDHGEELADHGKFGHGHALFEESVRVPFIVHFPDHRFAGRTPPAPVSLIDVLPTLAELASLPAPSGIDGISLVSDIRGDAPAARDLYAQLARGTQMQMVRSGDWKLVQRRSALALAQLFDLRRDPGELRDQRELDAARAAELRLRLQDRFGAARRPPPMRAPLGQRQVEALKSMGYVQ